MEIGIDHHQVLDGPQRTGRCTEGPAEEQGKQQGQQKKEQGRQGDGIGRIEDGKGHILNGPDGADTAIAVKSKIDQ